MRTNVISDFKTVEGNPTGGESKLPDSTTIKWQEGIVEGQQNGAFIEDVITAAISLPTLGLLPHNLYCCCSGRLLFPVLRVRHPSR